MTDKFKQSSEKNNELIDILDKKGKSASQKAFVLLSKETRSFVQTLRSGVGQFVYGQDNAIDLFLTGLFGMLNMSLIGESGCGKTYLVETAAELLGLKKFDKGEKIAENYEDEQPETFRMIIGHPEIMPSDLKGKLSPQPRDGKLEFQKVKGVLQATIVFVDEFNRIGPRSLSALLGPMNNAILVEDDGNEIRLGAEIGDKRRRYYLVILSSNPVSRGGNYSPPDAILDRTGLQLKFLNLDAEAQKRIVEQIGCPFKEIIRVKNTVIEDIRKVINLGGSNESGDDLSIKAMNFIANIRDEVRNLRIDTQTKAQIERFRDLLIKPKEYVGQLLSEYPGVVKEEISEGLQEYIWDRKATGERIDEKELNKYILNKYTKDKKFISDKSERRRLSKQVNELLGIVGNIEP